MRSRFVGIPLPEVRWFRGDVDVTSSFNYEITYTVDGRTTLHIDEVFDEDAAQFTCMIENEHGHATSTAELVVQGNNFLSFSFCFIKKAHKLMGFSFKYKSDYAF